MVSKVAVFEKKTEQEKKKQKNFEVFFSMRILHCEHLLKEKKKKEQLTFAVDVRK